LRTQIIRLAEDLLIDHLIETPEIDSKPSKPVKRIGNFACNRLFALMQRCFEMTPENARLALAQFADDIYVSKVITARDSKELNERIRVLTSQLYDAAELYNDTPILRSHQTFMGSNQIEIVRLFIDYLASYAYDKYLEKALLNTNQVGS
jgi:hypothetical protein